jgi:hypothetical protein
VKSCRTNGLDDASGGRRLLDDGFGGRLATYGGYRCDGAPRLDSFFTSTLRRYHLTVLRTPHHRRRLLLRLLRELRHRRFHHAVGQARADVVVKVILLAGTGRDAADAGQLMRDNSKALMFGSLNMRKRIEECRSVFAVRIFPFES